jgi:predicted acetyltransferase
MKIDVGRPSARDLRAYERAVEHAFSSAAHEPASVHAWSKRVGAANMRVARVERRVAGGFLWYPMGQWFGGRRVPMWGIAAVGVLPEHRSKGVASALMRAAMEEASRKGVALSCLYPATQPVYRRVGFEQAGTYLSWSLSTDAIAARERGLEMREAGRADERTIRAIATEFARRSNGTLDRGDALWARILRPIKGDAFAYLAGDEGYVVYYKEPSGSHYDLVVRDWAALTPAATLRLLTFFADHRSLADHVKFAAGPASPMLRLDREQAAKAVRALRWMLRIVDVKAALEARGYGEGVTAEAHLDVKDDVLASNAGRWTLEVSGGRARVKRGGRGTIALDVRELAALYSGFVSPAEAGVPSLAPVFAGPHPWMAEIF